MRILHVWSLAGIAAILAKYQRKMGHEVKVMVRKGYDPFGIEAHYGVKGTHSLLPPRGKRFLKDAVKTAKNYDVIHVHHVYEIVPAMKRAYPDKIVVLHYHGTELRENPQEARAESEKYADRILVATPDLLRFVKGAYIPNPIDTELFSPREITRNGKALCIMTKAENETLIARWLKEGNTSLDYETLDRNKTGVPYSKMPELLEKYEYYIDLKNDLANSADIEREGVISPAYSTTGLQALSMGLKVLNYECKVVQGLPDMHRPENVAKKVEEHYRGT